MKILLRDVKTQKFLCACDEWTSEERAAMAFPNTRAALKFCLKQKLREVHLIMKFDDGSHFIRLVVPENLAGKSVDKTGRLFVNARDPRPRIAA